MAALELRGQHLAVQVAGDEPGWTSPYDPERMPDVSGFLHILSPARKQSRTRTSLSARVLCRSSETRPREAILAGSKQPQSLTVQVV